MELERPARILKQARGRANSLAFGVGVEDARPVTPTRTVTVPKHLCRKSRGFRRGGCPQTISRHQRVQKDGELAGDGDESHLRATALAFDA